MTGIYYRGILLRAGVLACVLAIGMGSQPARPQENFDSGKTPAQLYASDCAICHKSPQGLAKGGGLFGLAGFLREHYTASRESAAAIASYVESMDKGSPAASAKQGRQTTKGSDKEKTGAGKGRETKRGESRSSKSGDDKKPSESKSGESKPAETKSGETKSGETKSTETKSGETKSDMAKPDDAKPADAKPAEAKVNESKDSKSGEAKPADQEKGEAKTKDSGGAASDSAGKGSETEKKSD